MFCTNCGKEIPDGTLCSCQQTIPQPPPAPGPQYGQYAPPSYPQPMPVDNRKTYSILSYISILWLFGLLVKPEKFDPGVRFHVGQGIVASIASAALSIASSILTLIIKAIESPKVSFSGFMPKYGYPVADTISLILTLFNLGISITWLVLGIMNANRNHCKYLPVIGRFSFYK